MTLVFAVSAFVLGKDFTPTPAGKWATVVAMSLFVIAGVLGIIGNALWGYKVADAPTLRAMAGDHWQDSEVDARNVAAVLNIDTISSLRAGSNTKATILTVALGFQVAAIIALSVALIGEAAQHHPVKPATPAPSALPQQRCHVDGPGPHLA